MKNKRILFLALFALTLAGCRQTTPSSSVDPSLTSEVSVTSEDVTSDPITSEEESSSQT